MNRFLKPAGIFLFILAVCSNPAAAEKYDKAGDDSRATNGWSTFLRGGAVHQFDSDLGGGGSFKADRFFVQGGLGYAFDRYRNISLALGYGYDGYDFSGQGPFAGLHPWDDIHAFRISAPFRWGFGPDWQVFVIPSLRYTAESGADFGSAATGGGFAGFAYRFSDRLTLGPGIGAVTQIEDDASIFPVLIVNWKITDRLSLQTGRGLGATLGPGLTLNWQASAGWDVFFGGRYESLRFRLDDKGFASGGVGEDNSFPLVGGATYRFGRKGDVSLVGGLKLGGELRVEDEKGNPIIDETYDSALFLGLTFRLRF